jgi:hypothetical protein
MTTLICWVGVDSRGPSSAYIASDSRISWGANLGWNHGQKTFASKTLPEVFGFCGDVTFPSNVLNQTVSMIDNGILYGAGTAPEARLNSIGLLLKAGLEAYPSGLRNAFTVLYCSRFGEKSTSSDFRIARIAWGPRAGWTYEWLAVPAVSALVVAMGSGGDSAREWNERWRKSDVGGTSRAVFAGFCDHLRSGSDPLTGGAPQLVGIYRQGPAKCFGIITASGRTMFGLPIAVVPDDAALEWRNELFEVCDPATGLRKQGAQPQPRPGSMNRGDYH